MTRSAVAFVLLVELAAVAGCTKLPPPTVPSKPADVIVDLPTKQVVRDYEDFTGRTEATNTVEIRAQVTGLLDRVHFEKDGVDVKEGASLFDIDPHMFAAAVEQAKASVTQARAKLDRITREFERKTKISGAVSEEDKERVTGEKAEAEAAVSVAEAAQKIAETNLGYTKITAKFAGRISRRMVDPGNVVKANETLLTTLVALDPIYAAFDVDERTLLRIRRLILDGKVISARDSALQVQIGLADEDGYPHTGTITFMDNKVDGNTGTLRIRATMNNPKVSSIPGKWLMSPGLFVRVRLPVGFEKSAILVPEEAIGTDQGHKFVFIVDDKDEVQQRRLKTGQQFGSLRVVEEGIGPNDRVIVSGLQRVRRGVKVTPKQAERPTDRLTPAVPVAAGG